MASSLKRAQRLALTLGVAVAVGCGDDGPSGPILDPDKFELVALSGDDQSGLAGTVLPGPLSVAVRDRATGVGEPSVAVSWRVVQGSGESTRTTSITDEDGEAATRIVLGAASGPLRVEARVGGLDPVSFGNLTVLPAPTIASVTPTSADPGDTVEVRVNDLPAGLTAQVLFDGVMATLTSRQDGTPAVLRAAVPAPAGVCSGSKSVDVRLRAGGLTTGARAITVSVPPDPFQVGQVLVIEGTADVACALLPAAGGAAKYLLVALSAMYDTAGVFALTIGSSSVAFNAVDAPPQPIVPDSYSRLRAIERRLAERGLANRALDRDLAQLFAQPEVGDTREFWVINDLEGTSDGLTAEDFDRIGATLKFVGRNTLVYLDDDAPQPGLTQADIDRLGGIYDDYLYEADVDFFGEPSDNDENDRVILLLTPVVNSLTPRGAQSVAIGFFFGLDLFSPILPNCDECDFSNGGELFYGYVPDPNAVFGDERSRERVLEVLPGVMVHETEHMINFHFKVFENVPPSPETLWLSEALAHMAEELGGDVAYDAGETDIANDLWSVNFGRARDFLQAPSDNSLTFVEGQGTLGERGAAWLFLRWIADQYGDFIFRRVAQARPNSTANIEEQTGEPFFRLFADWAVAVWADDQAIPGLAERYQFPKWQLRGILVDSETDEYFLEPRQETFASFSSSPMTEFLSGASPFYIELAADGDTNALQLELSAADGAGLAILRYE